IDRLTVFEQDQRRNAHNAEAGSGFWIVIHVQLRDLHGVTYFCVQLLQNRSDHFARAAPWSPKINKNRTLSFDFRIEGLIGYVHDSHDNFLLIWVARPSPFMTGARTTGSRKKWSSQPKKLLPNTLYHTTLKKRKCMVTPSLQNEKSLVILRDRKSVV